MAWIKMRTNLATDGRVILIASSVKKSRVYVIGALYILWALADEHSTDGHLPGYNAATIDAATGIKGFASAAQAAGWLELQDHGSTIPRFEEHNGESAKQRALANKRVARWREGKRQSNAESVTKPLQHHKPDKRREEKNTKPPNPLSGECECVTKIYEAYPKRQGREVALKAAGKAVERIAASRGISPTEAATWLHGRVLAYAKSPFVSTSERQFIPMPATWFNQGRYDDDDSEWAARAQSNGRHPKPEPRIAEGLH